MATKYENYITGDDHAGTMFGINWECQTFTPSINHLITSVKLKMHKDPGAGASPGNITASIRATSSSLPTGLDLASGTTDGNTLTDDNAGEWREITFTVGALLLAGTEYAIVARVLTGDGSNYINWRYDRTSPAYTDGQRAASGNSGVDWTGASDNDHLFEEWGDPQGSGEGGSIFPSDPVARVSSIRHIFQPGSFRMQVGLGALGFDVDVAEATVREALDTAKPVEEVPPEPVITRPPAEPAPELEPVPRVTMGATPPGVTPVPMPTPEPGQITDYAKRIMETVAAKALQTRIAGLKAGVGAVVTPYVIDVLREKEQEAKTLIELQRVQKAASTIGITSYARQVLIKRAIELKQQLESLYRR